MKGHDTTPSNRSLFSHHPVLWILAMAGVVSALWSDLWRVGVGTTTSASLIEYLVCGVSGTLFFALIFVPGPRRQRWLFLAMTCQVLVRLICLALNANPGLVLRSFFVVTDVVVVIILLTLFPGKNIQGEKSQLPGAPPLSDGEKKGTA
jgi:hypothetical protein